MIQLSPRIGRCHQNYLLEDVDVAFYNDEPVTVEPPSQLT
jgi:hypothetical protein